MTNRSYTALYKFLIRFPMEQRLGKRMYPVPQDMRRDYGTRQRTWREWCDMWEKLSETGQYRLVTEQLIWIPPRRVRREGIDLEKLK